MFKNLIWAGIKIYINLLTSVNSVVFKRICIAILYKSKIIQIFVTETNYIILNFRDVIKTRNMLIQNLFNFAFEKPKNVIYNIIFLIPLLFAPVQTVPLFRWLSTGSMTFRICYLLGYFEQSHYCTASQYL